MPNTREEYIRTLRDKLELWKAQLEKLEVQAALAKAEARVEYHEQITDLRHKRDEAKRHGATGWLVKPVGGSDLLKVVNQVLTR